MSFFKEFKDDLSQAVSELLPDEELLGENLDDDQMVNTLETDIQVEANQEAEEADASDADTEESITEDDILEALNRIGEQQPEDLIPVTDEDNDYEEVSNDYEDGNIDKEFLAQMYDDEELDELKINDTEEEEKMDTLNSMDLLNENTNALVNEEIAEGSRQDNVTVITKGTTINGSIISDGSLEVMGTITGDIDCAGKLSIIGKVAGNSIAAEIFVNTSRLEGSLSSEGSVKIGVGTVVVGDITATSGVIAGAVKGEIDVNGPVVVDSTAIIKGNINAKSVQINNGAVIDGYCKLSYASVDIDNFFDAE